MPMMVLLALFTTAPAGTIVGKEVTEQINFTFPKGFLFGVSSAAYQIEGAWNEDGRGVSIWDTFVHKRPELIADGSNADVASDTYHKYKEDVQLLKQLGVNFYRFSISWSRILPKGHSYEVNQAGIEYYNNLINELLNNDIQPMVTMYHWDLPQSLQDLGGWTNDIIAGYFEDYARILFTNFADRVKWWITFNEPAIFLSGYSGKHMWAPGIDQPGVADYLGAYNVLLAHARAYHLYKREFKKQYRDMCSPNSSIWEMVRFHGLTSHAAVLGNVAMSNLIFWCQPMTNTTEDAEACERFQQFYVGLYAHPIFSREGDFPAIVKSRVAANSEKEGFTKSRLPAFTAREIKFIKGTSDFFALNYYTTFLGSNGQSGPTPSAVRDSGVITVQDPWWPSGGSSWLKVDPTGFRNTLNWIVKEYGNVTIFVTENGYSDSCGLNDIGRINYHVSYLKEMLKAIHLDGCDVLGYTAWSFLDNFQWTKGYTERFGLYHVNFEKPDRPRTPKESSKVLAEIINTRKIPDRFI